MEVEEVWNSGSVIGWGGEMGLGQNNKLSIFLIKKSGFNFKKRKKKFNYIGQWIPPVTRFKSIPSNVTMTRVTVLTIMRNTMHQIILDGALCTIDILMHSRIRHNSDNKKRV